MSIGQLTRLIPPPPEPLHADVRAWDETQRRLGITLPDEWRVFAATYGSGLIESVDKRLSLWIYNPLSPNFVDKVLSWQNRLYPEVLDCIEDETERARRESIYPKPHGEFPFGEDATDWRTSLWFDTATATGPDAWPIVVWAGGRCNRSGPSCERFSFVAGMTDFLVQWLSGAIVLPTWAKGPHTFSFRPDSKR